MHVWKILTISFLCPILLLPADFNKAKDASTQDYRKMARAYTKFGFDLYSKIVQARSDENILTSPASVAIALAMTYNGAAGETERAMATTLGLGDIDLQEVNDANKSLISELEKAIEKVELNIANSLWARKGLSFKQDFLSGNERYFGADVSFLDFTDHASPSVINGWVKEKTKGKIDEIVNSIAGDAILFLINAIYFKGSWTKEFDKEKTKEEPFHVPGGTTKKIPMMRQSGNYLYLENSDFQAISLPYGDKRMSMFVFLPAKEANLKAFHESLTAENWATWMAGFHMRDGQILLPRFKIEFETKLKDVLIDLGMGDAFHSRRADFSRMITHPEENAYIHDVIHKTFAEVNEEGTEAAAVTSVEMRLTSVQVREEPFRMVVDRPFFFAIRDSRTGLVLFTGSVVNPS